MTNYDLFQLTTYGNILPPGQGFGQDAYPAEWTELQAELELKEMEED
jgi:hypothetical protein